MVANSALLHGLPARRPILRGQTVKRHPHLSTLQLLLLLRPRVLNGLPLRYVPNPADTKRVKALLDRREKVQTVVNGNQVHMTGLWGLGLKQSVPQGPNLLIVGPPLTD